MLHPLPIGPAVFKLLQLLKTLLPMLVTLAGIVMLGSEMQPENAPFPILVTLFGITMFIRELQPENALFPILVTLSGITTLVIELQLEKAFAGISEVQPYSMLHPLSIGPAVSSLPHLLKTVVPILVTLAGIVMLDSELQPENAPFPITVMLDGIVTLVSELQLEKAFAGISEVQPYSMLHPLSIGPAVSSLPHLLKTVVPILVTLAGIVMLDSELQPENAPFPITVMLDGIVTLVSELQLEKAFAGISVVQPNSMLHPLPIGPAVFRLPQLLKPTLPMLVTLSGIVMFVR